MRFGTRARSAWVPVIGKQFGTVEIIEVVRVPRRMHSGGIEREGVIHGTLKPAITALVAQQDESPLLRRKGYGEHIGVARRLDDEQGIRGHTGHRLLQGQPKGRNGGAPQSASGHR